MVPRCEACNSIVGLCHKWCPSEGAKAKPIDMVNEPPHYRGIRVTGLVIEISAKSAFHVQAGPRATVEIEAVDVIEALGLGYHIGTCLKYLWRAGKKGDRIEDLKKARWFIDREIARAGK